MRSGSPLLSGSTIVQPGGWVSSRAPIGKGLPGGGGQHPRLSFKFVWMLRTVLGGSQGGAGGALVTYFIILPLRNPDDRGCIGVTRLKLGLGKAHNDGATALWGGGPTAGLPSPHGHNGIPMGLVGSGRSKQKKPGPWWPLRVFPPTSRWGQGAHENTL